MRGALLLLIGWTAVARAEIAQEPPAPAKDPDPAGMPAPPPPPPKKSETAAMRLSHYRQFEASVRFSTGLRAIAPYDNDSDYCGDTDTTRSSGFAAVCTGRSPFVMDLELGYGVARKIDAFLELRLGLEGDFGQSPSDTASPHQFHLSPGARFFFSDAGKSKLFTTAQIVLDTTAYKNVQGGSLSTDFGLRNMNGLWFDLDRAYGFYVFVAESASFARWLEFQLEAGIGIQGRYR